MSLSRFSLRCRRSCNVNSLHNHMENNPKELSAQYYVPLPGAVLGAQLGKGDGQLVGVAIGSVAGAWFGSSIG